VDGYPDSRRSLYWKNCRGESLKISRRSGKWRTRWCPSLSECQTYTAHLHQCAAVDASVLKYARFGWLKGNENWGIGSTGRGHPLREFSRRLAWSETIILEAFKDPLSSGWEPSSMITQQSMGS
jgi:hypothetical protein